MYGNETIVKEIIMIMKNNENVGRKIIVKIIIMMKNNENNK